MDQLIVMDDVWVLLTNLMPLQILSFKTQLYIYLSYNLPRKINMESKFITNKTFQYLPRICPTI